MRPMSSAGTRFIEVRLARLSLHRGGRTVLKGISWTIRPGERWVLAGANGAGKTQLLKLVAGIVWPAPAARATRHYLLGRQLSSTPFGIKDEIAWLGRQTGRLPWVLATHRLEDVPPSATHALVLSRGRIVHGGVRRGATLKRWIESQPRESPPESARRAARPGGRSLVRLTNARVYLEQRPVLQGISLTVRAGECWVIHGRNGSGKTTLLRTLYGDHGVAVGGAIERAGVGPGVSLEVFRKRVGLIAPHLQADHPAQLTVAEVVQSGRHASVGLNDAPSAADRSVARCTLALFGLTRLSTRPLGELSYGQSRRVLFARAWVREPELLLLDDPFAGVDAPTRRTLLERVLALAAGGTAVVMSAHRPGDWLGCASHEPELAGGCALDGGPSHPRTE